MTDPTSADLHGGGDRAELCQTLGDLLRDLTQESTRLAHAYAHRHGIHDTDFRALTLLHDAEQRGTPLSPSHLAELLGLSSGAVTYLVERLVTSGHITRESDPQDGRRAILRYSQHGHETAGAYFGPLGEHMAQAMARFDDEQIRTACRVLAAATEAMGSYDT